MLPFISPIIRIWNTFNWAKKFNLTFIFWFRWAKFPRCLNLHLPVSIHCSSFGEHFPRWEEQGFHTYGYSISCFSLRDCNILLRSWDFFNSHGELMSCDLESIVNCLFPHWCEKFLIISVEFNTIKKENTICSYCSRKCKFLIWSDWCIINEDCSFS